MTDPDPSFSINRVNKSLWYDVCEDSLLGKGKSSTVRRGTYNGQEVAVKRLYEKTLSSEDINLLLTIQHENIVKILAIEDGLENQYIVLELCLASLDLFCVNYKKVANRFSGFIVVKENIIRDAVKGLEYLHKRWIVHRDIKPGNILLLQKGSSSEVKAVLADFGISTKLTSRDSKTTHRGRVTDTWMAPELLLDDPSGCKFSRQSDIFSMGCVTYYLITKGHHPFNRGHDNVFRIHQNVKNYVTCDFQLLNDKPLARALIKNMIKYNKDSRPCASEVLGDPYFKEDGPQDIIQVPQDSEPDQNKVYGKQLYHAMVSISHSVPQYIVDNYTRLLAVVGVKSYIKPDWSLSKRFLELYSTHASQTSPQVAASYVDKILTGLGYEEIKSFKAYLRFDVDIDSKVTEKLKELKEFRPAVIQVVYALGLCLNSHQVERYRMVVTVLRGTALDANKSFIRLFTDLMEELGKYPLAVAITVGVLERSDWGDTRKLKPFSLPNFDINTSYPKIDLCLTVADYYGKMSDIDFSSAKVCTSVVHLKSHNVSNMSRVQFTLLLMERGVIEAGDVSKIEDKIRYPIFFEKYKQRCKGPSKETETVMPSLTSQDTVATQETVAIQETEGQATSVPSQSTLTYQPSILTQSRKHKKYLVLPHKPVRRQHHASIHSRSSYCF
ncbi:PREDICTED: calcium-dependent protein kinase 3-like isoform X1 [Amphimedon queenslandica]|uniref:Protein kinase domain-containing protein n=1 Tax=Amphimedon queenslandica TaxID=400682 RepID=A0AAN0JCE4_AMPQE|nr:PREDICTED: calcium-dependent protein kinase 3-like isoform X1 [Amphimedon queenslandica]|eukprot:XP_019854373.1 PREDICTED: calcium-dependent protein kinase 3-like isoform X1 [Amphimedon queenslandica]